MYRTVKYSYANAQTVIAKMHDALVADALVH